MSVELPDVVNSNSVWVTFIPHGGAPEWMEVIVGNKKPEQDLGTRFENWRNAMERWQSESKTNRNAKMPAAPPADEIDFDHAKWLPFKNSLLVDLGPGDGQRELVTSFRYKGQTKSDGGRISRIEVRTTLPTIAISDPPEGITSQPRIQLKGWTSRPPINLRYSLSNQSGQIVGGGEGTVSDQYFDEALFGFTTNYFHCYDVALDVGTNTFTFSADDFAGNHFSTKHVVIFTTAGDTSPPAIKIDWPHDGNLIAGSEFVVNGTCDDPTAEITALVCDDQGNGSRRDGSVGRDSLGHYGGFIVERVPLSTGIEYVTVVATDAATNSSLVHIAVGKSDYVLYMDPIANPQELWERRIAKVTGYCSRTNHPVSVNGVKATMKSDGHWEAENVPNTSDARFLMTADDAEDKLTPSKIWQPAFLGAPTKSLSAGLSLQPVSTNEYNHYRIYLGFTNTSGRSIPSLTWILPKEESRYVLHLYDSTNREVTRGGYMLKFGEPMETNINIHHLGKSELAKIEGIIPFPTNSAALIASLNLDEYFPLQSPGDYRLEAGLRLYKISDTGQLTPFEFPVVSTTIHVIDQPSEITFYLNDLERQGILTWGAERYGMRMGVVHGMKSSQPSDANLIEIFLQKTSTNDYRNWNLRLPTLNEQFDVTLYDAAGKEVPTTNLGKQQGQPLSLDGQNSRTATGGRRLRPVFVSAKDATDCARFNLNDYFEIKTPGKYRLKYQERFYRLNTNSILAGVIMPTVTVPLDIIYVSGQ